MILYFFLFLNFFTFGLSEKGKKKIKNGVSFLTSILFIGLINKKIFKKSIKNFKKEENKKGQTFTFDLTDIFNQGQKYKILIFEDKNCCDPKICDGFDFINYFYECEQKTSEYKKEYSSNIFYKDIQALKEFFLNSLNDLKKAKNSFFVFEEEKLEFRKNLIFQINNLFFSSIFLNECYESYRVAKNNSNNKKKEVVWALRQKILLNTSDVYEKKEDYAYEANLISSFGYTGYSDEIYKKEFVDRMHESIFEEFSFILRSNENKINVLCLPAIGLGVFVGDPKVYWNSMFDILKKNEKLCEAINNKKVFIYYNAGKKISEFNEFTHEFKKLINIFIKDVYGFAYQIKKEDKNNLYEVSILNPSNRENLQSVKNLGFGTAGENNIDKSTSIRLNDLFEEMFFYKNERNF